MTRVLLFSLVSTTAACVAMHGDGTNRSTSGESGGAADTPASTVALCVETTTISDTFGGGDSPVVVAREISEKGHVVGSAWVAAKNAFHAFYWDGTMHDLGTLGGSRSDAWAINVHDEVVGSAEDKANDSSQAAFSWKNGEMIRLADLGGGESAAADINDAGDIVGSSRTANGETHAVLWSNGVVKDLGTLSGHSSSAERINERGDILGLAMVSGDWPAHVFLWRDGTMTDLGGHEGKLNERGDVVVSGPDGAFLVRNGTRTAVVPFGDATRVYVYGFNALDQIVGTATRPDGTVWAYLWDDGNTTLIGPADQSGWTNALAVNDSTQVAGAYGDPPNRDGQRAFSWKDGVMTFLTPEHSQAIPTHINNAGQILGSTANGAAIWEVAPCDTTGNDAGAGGGSGDDDGGSSGKAW